MKIKYKSKIANLGLKLRLSESSSKVVKKQSDGAVTNQDIIRQYSAYNPFLS